MKTDRSVSSIKVAVGHTAPGDCTLTGVTMPACPAWLIVNSAPMATYAPNVASATSCRTGFARRRLVTWDRCRILIRESALIARWAAKHAPQRTLRSATAALKVTFFSDTSVAGIVLRAPMRTRAGVCVWPVQRLARTAGVTHAASPASRDTSSMEKPVLNSVHRRPSVIPAGGAVSLVTAPARHVEGLGLPTVTSVVVGTLHYMGSVPW